jgi:hypothetical protein
LQNEKSDEHDTCPFRMHRLFATDSIGKQRLFTELYDARSQSEVLKVVSKQNLSHFLDIKIVSASRPGAWIARVRTGL